MQKHDRYINNELLGCISRPQHENSCSLTSLTAVFNYLFAAELGLLTSEDLAASLGIQPPGCLKYGPGNRTIMQWFKDLCHCYGVSGNCHIYLRGKEVGDDHWHNNAQVFSDLKDTVRSKTRALIYHMDNHYNLVIGYFEHSIDPGGAYETGSKLQRWIILGEHSDYNPIPKIIQRAMQSLPPMILSEDRYNLIMERAAGTPVWSRRWRSIRHDLINSPNHCLLLFES